MRINSVKIVKRNSNQKLLCYALRDVLIGAMSTRLLKAVLFLFLASRVCLEAYPVLMFLLQKKRFMANVGIEPKTFALLARRSNQLS